MCLYLLSSIHAPAQDEKVELGHDILHECPCDLMLKKQTLLFVVRQTDERQKKKTFVLQLLLPEYMTCFYY